MMKDYHICIWMRARIPKDTWCASTDVTRTCPWRKCGFAIAAEQSTGTWTGISTLRDDVFERNGARVTRIEGDLDEVAYPAEISASTWGECPRYSRDSPGTFSDWSP